MAYDNLKSHKKKQSFIHSLEDKVLEKFTGGRGGGVNLPHLAFLGLIMAYIFEQVCIANLPWKIFLHECVWN